MKLTLKALMKVRLNSIFSLSTIPRNFFQVIDWDLPWVHKKIFSSRSSFFDISGHEEGFSSASVIVFDWLSFFALQGLAGNSLRGFFHFAGIMFVFYTVAENVQSIRFKGQRAQNYFHSYDYEKKGILHWLNS